MSQLSAPDARGVAEAARESQWRLPSFGRQLFLGELRLDLIYPQPTSLNTGRAFLRLPDDRVVKVDTPRLPAVTVDPARLAAVEDEYRKQWFRPQPAATQVPDGAVFTRPAPIPRRGTR